MSKHIITGDAYKNWRLNGAAVHSPQDDPERFTGLRKGDFAVVWAMA